MLKSISWGQYSLAVLGLVVLYYAYLGLAYYRAELLSLLKGKAKAAELPSKPEPKLSSPVGRGPLVAPPVATITPVSAAPAPAPAPAEAAAPASAESVATGVDLPALDLPTAEVIEIFNDEINSSASFYDSNSINFTQQITINIPQGTETEVTLSPAADELDFSVGVAQLGNYLGRVDKGELTQAQLAELVPALANTDLLVACFQANAQRAQRTTARLYAGITEPTVD